MSRSKVNPRSYRTVKNLINIFENSSTKVFQTFGKKQSEELMNKVKNALLNQTIRHKPLSPAYLEQKRRQGLDTRILIATGDYVESITVTKEKIRKRTVWRIGVPENKIHAPSGLPYKILARIHEFGSKKRNIPARPHWRPVYSAYIREFPKTLKTVKKDMVRDVNTQLKRARSG